MLNSEVNFKEEDFVWLCDECDELYEEPTAECEICTCDSLRVVAKSEMGM